MVSASYGIVPKVSASLGLGIGPKLKQWFRSYTNYYRPLNSYLLQFHAKPNKFDFKGCKGVINVSLEGNAQIRHGEKAGCYFHQNEEVNGQTYWIKVCNYFILPGAVGYS